MPDFAITAFAWNMTHAVIAVFIAWVILRQLDRMAKIKFPEVMEKIHESSFSLSLYFGLRFLGVCLLIGDVVS